jgi:hypothetical protein
LCVDLQRIEGKILIGLELVENRLIPMQVLTGCEGAADNDQTDSSEKRHRRASDGGRSLA